MEFPQYRRYKNGQSYFKVLSQSKFVEYKRTANKLHSHRFKAKILPDRNYIQDMLYQPEPYWEVIDEGSFQQFIEQYTD